MVAMGRAIVCKFRSIAHRATGDRATRSTGFWDRIVTAIATAFAEIP
jgi:hypothetical protein